MTVQWTEGFEVRRTAAAMSTAYAEAPTDLDLEAGRFTDQSMDFTTGNDGHFLTPILDSDDTWVCGFALEVTDWRNGAGLLFGLYDGATEQVGLYIYHNSSEYEFRIYQGGTGGTLLATSAAQAPGVGFNYWEIRFVIANSGGSWELRKNGVNILSGTGDTQSSAAAEASQIKMIDTFSSGIAAAKIDDIYILNGNGAFNTDFLGDQIIEGLLVDSAGTNTQWAPEESGSPSGSPNHQMVDDLFAPDGDTTYVKSGTAGQKDTYGFENLSVITGSINAVVVDNSMRLEAGGARSVKNLFRNGASEAQFSSPMSVDSTTYEGYISVADRDPNDNSAFTPSKINSGEFGVELTV